MLAQAEKVVRYKLTENGVALPGYWEKVSNKDAMVNEHAKRANITPETVVWFLPEKTTS